MVKIRIRNKFIRKLFTLIYKKTLTDHYGHIGKVAIVTGHNSAYVDYIDGRKHVWIEWWRKD